MKFSDGLTKTAVTKGYYDKIVKAKKWSSGAVKRLGRHETAAQARFKKNMPPRFEQLINKAKHQDWREGAFKSMTKHRKNIEAAKDIGKPLAAGAAAAAGGAALAHRREK
jgi:hypothetical protein